MNSADEKLLKDLALSYVIKGIRENFDEIKKEMCKFD